MKTPLIALAIGLAAAGCFDDLALWNRALTDEEINQLCRLFQQP